MGGLVSSLFGTVLGGATSGGELGGLLVLAIHRHALTGKDVCESALVAELAVSLDEPCTYLLCLARFEDLVGEGAGRAGGARADLEKFAGNMGEVLGYEERRVR